MYPILYAASMVTEGTVPTHRGKGTLSDCISCECSEERNGAYELTMVYPITGIHASEILANDILKVKSNAIDQPQLFRIYRVGKAMNGKFTVKAAHISYDLSGKIMTANIGANTAAAACAALQACAGNFTITTDIPDSTTKTFFTNKPQSVRSWFSGSNNGSLTGIFDGVADWRFDNYSCSFLLDRGQQHNVPIHYGKNLTELSQEVDIDNLVTAIVPYYIDKNTKLTVMGTDVSTGLSINVDRKIAIDFTSEIDFDDSGTTPAAQLQALASAYVTHNYSSIVYPVESLSISFINEKDGVSQVVNLCDTALVTFDALGISATYKCVAVTYDVIGERYTKATLGVIIPDVSDSLLQTNARVKNAVTKDEAKEVAEEAAEDVVTSGEENAEFSSVLSQIFNLGSRNSLNPSIIDRGGSWACVPDSFSKFELFTGYDDYDSEMTRFQLYTQKGSSSYTRMHFFSNDIENPRSTRIELNTTTDDDAEILLKNNYGANNIKLTSSDGKITCVSLTQTSSGEVKKNIVKMTVEEARKILQLLPVTFDFKNEDYGTDRRGFIAEDVEKVIPQLVSHDSETASLDYISMIPYLVGVIKDQEERIKSLEDKLKGGTKDADD